MPAGPMAVCPQRRSACTTWCWPPLCAKQSAGSAHQSCYRRGQPAKSGEVPGQRPRRRPSPRPRRPSRRHQSGAQRRHHAGSHHRGPKRRVTRGCDGPTSIGTVPASGYYAVVGPTKTHQARRVSLDVITLALLDTHRARVDNWAKAGGVEVDADGYILTLDPTGHRPMTPDSLTQGFVRLAKRCGVKVRFHDLRHFTASQLIASGHDPVVIAGRLGHTDATTTLKLYAHALEERDRQAADLLGALMQPDLSERSSLDRRTVAALWASRHHFSEFDIDVASPTICRWFVRRGRSAGGPGCREAETGRHGLRLRLPWPRSSGS